MGNQNNIDYDSEPERTLFRRRREVRRVRQAMLEHEFNMAAENNYNDLNLENQNNKITLGQYINPTARVVAAPS
ncbi:hypothetical protein PIB30_045849 [Stylosanthes scabra]|uniref:Uncharacterized protein n=1 Tax=Stylosanthes scabra TaxID=79078 RepID=A0ABU6WEN0_9FABA|nr:hypothetical protein [Stylosanthes scabra]